MRRQQLSKAYWRQRHFKGSTKKRHPEASRMQLGIWDSHGGIQEALGRNLETPQPEAIHPREDEMIIPGPTVDSQAARQLSR